MKKGLIIGGCVLLVFLLIGWALPKKYDVHREIKINAKASEIHAIIGDLKNWKDNWGSWQGGDSSVTNTLGDQTSGVGASQTWKSKNGGGKIVFLKSDKNGIEYKISFDKEAIVCSSYLRYEESGDLTIVTWGIIGATPNPILGGYLSLMMDTLISGTIESDLYFLKKVVEKSITENKNNKVEAKE